MKQRINPEVEVLINKSFYEKFRGVAIPLLDITDICDEAAKSYDGTALSIEKFMEKKADSYKNKNHRKTL